ncbi:Hypothetical predicted protein [Olea europaea subsp. europaea]|uniref:Uncharacterized protein n=1 Tax=Olea europaea subsp. europaea TaxID=158383 RepID=A0A8S0VDS4_OLEEU|nr:Hypothetical predicted protein [Olea europaea subsp. europaea]
MAELLLSSEHHNEAASYVNHNIYADGLAYFFPSEYYGDVEGEEATQGAEAEKQRAEDEHTQIGEDSRKVQEVNGRAKEAIQRTEEAEAKAIKAAYIVALEKLIKHIRRERPNFNAAFLDEALEKKRKELQRLSEAARFRLSLANEDAEINALTSQDPLPLEMSHSLLFVF